MDTTLSDPLVDRLLDGRYAVQARLARGGMASVYLAIDTRLDRRVAVKVMHPGLAEDPDFVARFNREARAAAALGQAPERLAVEVEPGVTLADELNSVAVHNAYHFGKIVALRQRIGAWPPTGS